jgi:hypothetical protein
MVHDSVVQLYPSLIDNFRAGIGPYVEVAFFHKKSRTLLVTDAVIYVSDKPPEVVGRQSLLNAAKNGLAVRILSDESTRQRGMIVATHEKDRKLLVMAVVFG